MNIFPYSFFFFILTYIKNFIFYIMYFELFLLLIKKKNEISLKIMFFKKLKRKLIGTTIY